MTRPRGGPLDAVTSAMRGALWPIPTLGVVAAVAAGIALPRVDALLERDGSSPVDFVFGGGPAAARDLLAAIAGSLISVTGLTFSLTVVALQLASSQYSPRLLQTFATDRVVQSTLAQLVLTFVYSLTVLRSVRTESATTGSTAFVPRVSITLAYLLTLGSVVALVLFLGHLARALRVETLLREVHEEANATVHRELDDDPAEDRAGGPPAVTLPAGPSRPVPARSSGFLVDVDERGLVRVAAEHGAVLLLVPRLGDGVVTGTPVVHAWPDRPGAPLDIERLAEDVDRRLGTAFERRNARDVSYGLRKLVDIAVRALSPGTNDPTTAVHALAHVSAVLGDLLAGHPAPRALRDDGDQLRLVVPQWDAGALLQLATEEPLQFAEGQPAVLRRLAAVLREVAWRAPGQVDDALRLLVRRTAELAGESTAVTAEERRLWVDDVELALAGRWREVRP